ncbi:DUF4181 domain-containing protein [Oceanobacillus jeddahense]|uniref:DUF4181 domain-containing protein n=1 Tax=Oceanobacillus jeddahense TaxID=1462527 RepID=UPI00363F38B6
MVMVIAVYDFPNLRIWIFISMTAMFAFRTIMRWIFTRENKAYLTSAITCGLFIMGAIAYSII